MAILTKSTRITISFLLVSALLFVSAQRPDLPRRGPVRGQVDVPDPTHDKMVQELGRFSVDEYNKSLLDNSNGQDVVLLTFYEVVKARIRLVSGLEYYLTIAASDGMGNVQTYDATVFFQPWTNTTQLLSFTLHTDAIH